MPGATELTYLQRVGTHAESDPGSDRAEQLLLEVVSLPEAEQAEALTRLIEAEPELAAELRQRFELYRRLLRSGPVAAPSGAFGEYELVRELGRGGMGIVYLARQRRGDQERLVALKLLRDRALCSPQARERLRREGAAAFRLDHPGLCQVLDVGEVDGTPYLTMRFVAGATLAEHIATARDRGRPLELPRDITSDTLTASSTQAGAGGRLRAALALVENVARALHVAHEAGLVHRDVKPGNIMVTPDGSPVLLDFGLVRDDSSSHALTVSGQPLGTPAYMSPEQIELSDHGIDRTTDVYSLGATLFELLTLRQPFTGQTREALFHEILTGRPPDLRATNAAVPRDLRVVVETAMARDARRRYATALEFAEELRRVRLAQPIHARPPSLARRLWLWCRRNPIAAALLALLASALGANAWFAADAMRSAAEARSAEAAAKDDLETARDAISEMALMARTHLADVPWLDTERRELLERAMAFQRALIERKGNASRLVRDEAILRVELASLAAALADTEAARSQLTDAVSLLHSSASSGDIRALSYLADAYGMIAGMAEDRGDEPTTVTAARSAIAILGGIQTKRALTGREASIVSRAHRTLAELLRGRRQPAAATAEIDAALAIAAPDNDYRVDTERARLLEIRARLASDRRDTKSAHADLLTGIELLRAVVADRPHDRRALSALANLLVTRGATFAAADDLTAAMSAYDESLVTQERLIAAFPESLTYQANLARTLGSRALTLRRLGQIEASQLALQRAVTMLAAVAVQRAEDLSVQEDLARLRYNLANGLPSAQKAQAIELYGSALATLEQLLVKNPKNDFARSLAAAVANSLGGKLAGEEREAEALAAFGTARGHGAIILEQDPDNLRELRGRGMLLFNEGTLACELGDLAAAAERLTEALQLDARVVAKAAADPRHHAQLRKHHLRRAQIAQLQDPTTSLAHWRNAAAAADQIPAELRARVDALPDARSERAAIERGFGEALTAASDLAAATLAFARTDEARADRPANLFERVEQLLLHHSLAALADAQGDAEARRRALVAAIASAAPLVDELPKSRLHSARVRAALPALIARATAHGVADPEQTLTRLLTAASSR